MTILYRRALLLNWVQVLVFLGLWLPSAVWPDVALAASQNMEITVREKLVSVRLTAAPLDEVLQQLAQEFQFKTHFHGDLTEPITLSFTDLPLEKCLRRLTANQSLSIAYGPAATASPKQPEGKSVSDIWVLGQGATSKKPARAARMPALPAPVPGDVPEDLVEDSEDQLEEEDPEEGPEENLLLDQILKNPNADKANQRQTIQDLVEIGDAESVLTMAEYLGNADKELQQMLIDGIGSVKNEQATTVLSQLLQGEDDPEIRKTVVQALAKRQGDSIAKELLEEALTDRDEGVKTLARQLLAK